MSTPKPGNALGRAGDRNCPEPGAVNADDDIQLLSLPTTIIATTTTTTTILLLLLLLLLNYYFYYDYYYYYYPLPLPLYHYHYHYHSLGYDGVHVQWYSIARNQDQSVPNPAPAMDFSWENQNIKRNNRANLLQVRLTVGSPKTRVSVHVAQSAGLTTKKKKKTKRPASDDPQWEAEAGPRKLAKSSGSDMTDSTYTGAVGEDASIKVGSDCSGLGTEIFAMEALGLGHRVIHMFGSELDKVINIIIVIVVVV
jgi:hypothetical protein